MLRTQPMIVATYNVHRCIGTDGQHRPERVAAVLAEIGPDLVGLQEVGDDASAREVEPFHLLARSAGMEMIVGPTLESGAGCYGNAVLTRLPVCEVDRIDLSVPGREPRGAIAAVVESVAGRVRVLVTHLGLGRRERRAQARRLARWLAEHDDGTPVVLLGDLNSVSGTSLTPLRRRMLSRPRGLRTFPAQRPLLPLDRIWASPAGLLEELRVHRSPLARVASDHLPLRARLRLR